LGDLLGERQLPSLRVPRRTQQSTGAA
jgi:hypothetical protein